MQIRELKGSVYDLPDIECGSLLKLLKSKVATMEIEKADIVIVEGYLVKNRHNAATYTEAVLVTRPDMNDKYIIIEGGRRVPSVCEPDTLYITLKLTQAIADTVDPVRHAGHLYKSVLNAIKPYMWDTCGYSQESKAFDIVLAVEEILNNLDQSTPTKDFYFPMINVEEFKEMLRTKYKQDPNDSIAATVLWCAITSALARKYKQLTETDSTTALTELVNLANTLNQQDFIRQEDIERVV